MLNNLTNNPLQHVIPDNFDHTFQNNWLNIWSELNF